LIIDVNLRVIVGEEYYVPYVNCVQGIFRKV